MSEVPSPNTPTVALLEWIECQRDTLPYEAIEKLSPGQQARIKFCAYARQLAYGLKSGLSVRSEFSNQIEGALERSVDETFRPFMARVEHEARRDKNDDADEIAQLRAELAASRARVAELKRALQTADDALKPFAAFRNANPGCGLDALILDGSAPVKGVHFLDAQSCRSVIHAVMLAARETPVG